MAMAAGSIVKHLDVFEDICLREIAGSADPLSDSLLFQAAEERFSYGVDTPQQLPRRLMLGSSLCVLQKRIQSRVGASIRLIPI